MIDKDKELALQPELLSVSSMNQFTQHNSSPRVVMFNGHLSQMLPLENGEERIIQSGVERELGKHTFKKTIDCNAKIIGIIPRYRKGIEYDSVNHVVEKLIIYENLDNDEYDMLEIPYVSDNHQYFGFRYVHTDTLKRLSVGDMVKAGTVLAQSTSVSENDGYKFGTVLNVSMMTHPEITNDGMVISESAAKDKLNIKIYEKREVSFGINKFPLNLYGDKDNYKAFPEIGEYIKDNGLLMVLREQDELNAPILMSKNDVMEYNPMFDECVYCKKGYGKIVDIRSNYIPKYRHLPLAGTDTIAKKYSNGLEQYYKEIKDTCENAEKEYFKRYQREYSTSPALTRLLVESMVYLDSVSPETYKDIKMVYKNDPTDIYRITFTIETELAASNGFKLTDISGGFVA